jgi:hypothetical protein
MPASLVGVERRGDVAELRELGAEARQGLLLGHEGHAGHGVAAFDGLADRGALRLGDDVVEVHRHLGGLAPAAGDAGHGHRDDAERPKHRERHRDRRQRQEQRPAGAAKRLAIASCQA